MKDAPLPFSSDIDAPEDTASQAVSSALAVAARRKGSIALGLAASLALGLLFVAQSIDEYTSHLSLIVDLKQVGLGATSQFDAPLSFETDAIDSQALLLPSDRMGGRVIEDLDLIHDARFLHPPRSGLATVAAFLRDRALQTLRGLGVASRTLDFDSAPPEVQRRLLLKRLNDHLNVARRPHTYVLSLDYTDPDPALAQAIAAAYAAAYLDDQLTSRFDGSRRAASWLQSRTAEIKQKADDAVQIAEAYRVRHRLTATSGRLINEQSLNDSNAELSTARNELNSAAAKYALLTSLVDSHDYAGSTLDALNSPIISALRAKYLDASKTYADISSRLGAEHEAALKAHNEMAEYEALIFQELTRLRASYESEVRIATQRVAALEASLENTRQASESDATALSTLRALEQEASTYQGLYSVYLQKTQDLVQQTTMPISNARIVNDADFPLLPSRPKTFLILLASSVLGIVLGGALAALQELRERGFRTARQARDELGFEFVSYVPQAPVSSNKSRSARPSLPSPPTDKRNLFRTKDSRLASVLHEPLSPFAEALRSVKLAHEFRLGGSHPVVIGFVSALPGEGRSTMAKNFATLLAAQDQAVLLIDCDFRNPGLTRALTPAAPGGLLERLDDARASIDDFLCWEQGSNLAFLPAAAAGRAPDTADRLASPEMTQLISHLQGRFPVIVVDLAPIGELTDASAAAQFVDGYQLIVEWARTPRATVSHALAASPLVSAKIIGVSLNKVEVNELARFTGVDGRRSRRRYLTVQARAPVRQLPSLGP